MLSDESFIQSLKKLYLLYEKLWKVDVSKYELGSTRLILPIARESLLTDLCKVITDMFTREPIVLNIDSNCIVMGDIHGHILDLFRVLNKFGTPEKNTYLFLGDLVDRGEFSIETVTLIFILKALYPKNVFIIRGNHEFPAMFQFNGFSKQVEETYGNHTVTYAFSQAFTVMPLAAKVFNKIFCVHGGIGEGFTTTDDLYRLQRPILSYERDPVMSAVWSDPNSTIFENNFLISPRGLGYHFSKEALEEFLHKENLKLLVRGHEPCDEGFHFTFDDKLVTVFSASNYCGYGNNKAAVMIITQHGEKYTFETFAPLKYLSRNQAAFSAPDQKDCYHLLFATKSTGLSQKNLPLLQRPSIVRCDADIVTPRRTGPT